MNQISARERTSELRALRLLTAVIAGATLVATVGTSFATGTPDPALMPQHYRVAFVLALLVPLAAGVAAPGVGVRVLRAFNAATVATFVALLLTYLLIALQEADRPVQVPWVLTVTAGPVTAALVAAGWVGAVGTLGVTTTLLQLIRLTAGSDAQDAFANDVFTFFGSAAILLFASQFVRVSRDFERATALARAAETQRSEDEARVAATERMQALVHDELLSTLSLAARDVPSLRSAVASRARRARHLLEELRAPGDELTPSQESLELLLRQVIADEDPRARWETDPAPPAQRIPLARNLIEAITGATRQALANSVMHAGQYAERTVLLRHDSAGVDVVVHDNGIGFDPASIDPTRMGLSTSILGRMRALPGADARIESAPHSGTTVTLAWRIAGAQEHSLPDDATPPAGSIMFGGDSGGASGVRVYGMAVTVLLIAQAVLAALAAQRAGSPWPALLGSLGVAGGFIVLGSPRAALTTRRAWLVVAVVAATAAVSWLPVTRDPERFGDLWFIAAVGFVLLVLAMRGRPREALGGAALVACIALGGAAMQSNDASDVVAATTRMVGVVVIGAGFQFGIERVRARTASLRRLDLDVARQAAFQAAERHELRGRSVELERLIGDVLERLEQPGELTPATRRECVMLEGRLRDGYRAGRLARYPLLDTAMAARGRGVDVALFDDPEGRDLSEPELQRIVEWMSERLTEVAEGRFTGRVLPAGREAVASAATDERAAELRFPYP